MRSFRLFPIIGLVFTVGSIAACQPTVSPNAEPEVAVSSTPITQPTLSFTPSVTPRPSPAPTATPPQILGRFATDPAQIAFLRVVHAAPDTTPVDVYVDSSPLVSGLEYGLASGRTNVNNGQYTVYIVERGTEPPASDQRPASPLASAAVNLSVGASTLLVLNGTPDELTLNAFEESNTPLNSGLSRVSVIHAVPSVAEVIVRQASGEANEETNEETSEETSETLIDAVAFSQRSESIEIASAETVLDFVVEGQTAFSYPFNPLPRTDYVLVLYGLPDAGDADAPRQLGVLSYDHLVPGRAEVRVINASTVSSSLDIYLNDNLFTPNVGVNSAGERQTIADGPYTIEIYPAGADAESTAARLSETQFTLLPDTTQALLVVGGEESLQVLPFAEDLSPLPPDAARIAYINALESAPAAQVGNDSAVREDIGTVGYGQGSAYFPINIGVNNVFWISDEGFLEDTELQAEAGRSYLYFLTGSETPVILSEAVEVDEALADVPQDSTQLLFTPSQDTRIRVINVNEESVAIDFTLNSIPLAANLAYGESSAFQQVEGATFPIAIRQSGGEMTLLERDLRLSGSGDFTIIIYGHPGGLNLLTLSEQDFIGNGLGTTLRFVNASIDETVPMGLIVTEPSESGQAAPGGQSSVPIGSTYLIDSQDPLTFSAQIPIPLSAAGFIVSDNRSNLIGAQIDNYTLEEGKHYDIVAIYLPQTDTLRAVIVPHPEA